MKSKIINNTLLFIAIMIYILAFKAIFGEDNILIGVMSITGLLMYLGRDLTGDPIRNTLGIILFYVMIGIGSFISSGHIILAIPINFIIVFIISYSFGHVLKSPMYIPFTLLYLFLLAYPVSISKMPLRVAALVVGAGFMMLPQFVINRNKINKASSKIFIGLVNIMLTKIKRLRNNEDVSDLEFQIRGMSMSLKDMIYDKKTKNFYISKVGQARLDFLVSFEKLNLILNDLNINKDQKLLGDIEKLLMMLKSLVINYERFGVRKFMSYIDDIYGKSNVSKEKQFLASAILLDEALWKMHNEPKKFKSEARYRQLKNDIHGLKDIKFNSIKIIYGIRIGIEVVIACFIVQYFHLEQGRWILYTVLSLTNPVLEMTKSKAKDRLFATMIGATFIAITFSIFKNSVVRGLIVIIAGYVNVYCSTYRQKITVVTISAVGSAALVGGDMVSGIFGATPILLSLERIIFISIGVVIALIINTFIFKYDVEKANVHLKEVTENLEGNLISNLNMIAEKNKIDDYMNNVYLIISQVDRTIRNNIEISDKLDLEDRYSIEYQNRMLFVVSIYEINNFMNQCDLSDLQFNSIKNNLFKLKTIALDGVSCVSLINNQYLKEILDILIIANEDRKPLLVAQ